MISISKFPWPSHRRGFLRLVLPTALSLVAIPFAGAIEMDVTKMNAHQVEQRGKQLRAEVERIYAKRRAENSLKPMGAGRNFITPDVLRFIPLGTSFDEAEAILRAAGCVVSSRAKNTQRQALSYKDNVLAQLRLSSAVGSVTEFLVTLTPRAVGDYSVVDDLTAEIAVIFS